MSNNLEVTLGKGRQALFAGMSNLQIDNLIKLMHGFVKHYVKSDYICLADGCVANLYILLSGSLQLIKEDFWGDKRIIEGLGPGYVFTEAYLGKERAANTVSYLAVSDSEVLVLPLAQATIKEELETIPMGSLIYNLLNVMAEENRQLIEKNSILCEKTLREKITTYLLDMAEEKQSATFDIPFNHTDLASFLDADRSSLARELSKMREEGLIEFKRRTFTILQDKNKHWSI